MARPSKNIFLQVLWTGVDNNIPSLFLFTDTKRYVFNCSEGTQRLFTQYKMKIGKLDTFFLTRYQWSHMGGLPGFGMTLRDAKSHMLLERNTNEKMQQKSKRNIEPQKGEQERAKKTETRNVATQGDGVIYVHGPQGLKKVLEATRHFMRFDTSGIRFQVLEHGTSYNQKSIGSYKDEELIVHPIPIYDTQSKYSKRPYDLLTPRSDFITVSPKVLPPFLCYACHVHPVPGKFLVHKANELGIPHSGVRGKLTKGETVVLDDGRQIRPEQVVEPPLPGPVFLLVDCPDKSYLQNLTNNFKIKDYVTGKKRVDLVIHLTKQNICGDTSYEEWVKCFPATTKHVFLHPLMQKKVVFETQAEFQTMLNYINPQFFPLIHDNHMKVNLSEELQHSIYNFTKIHLRDVARNSSKYIDNDAVQPNNSSKRNLLEVVKELLDNINSNQRTLNNGNDLISGGDTSTEDSCQSIEQLHDELEVNTSGVNKNGKRTFNDQIEIPNKKIVLERDTAELKFPRVLSLGTGAAIPSKCRNVSATLVFLSDDVAVLFDCGEDTYGQLWRHYGSELYNVIPKIKIILISHMHADHHLGIITLLRQYELLKKDNDKEVLVVAPHLLLSWLSQYGEVSEKLNFRFSSCPNNVEHESGIIVQPISVNHPGFAHGFVVEYQKKMKITYSGDTMPCDDLVNAGMDSTLLIHEATLEDEMIDEAIARKHSTTSQALEVAQKMNAKNVLLTHFSQRYPRMPILKNTNLQQHTAFAFDHMEFTIGDIQNFHQLIPKLSAVFQKGDDDDDNDGIGESIAQVPS